MNSSNKLYSQTIYFYNLDRKKVLSKKDDYSFAIC